VWPSASEGGFSTSTVQFRLPPFTSH
jgi:hypothetical protein